MVGAEEKDASRCAQLAARPPPWPQTLLVARSPTPGKSESSSHPGSTEEVEPQLCSKNQLDLTSALRASVLWIWALTNARLAILDAVLSNADHSSASISTNLTVVCHIGSLDFKIQGS